MLRLKSKVKDKMDPGPPASPIDDRDSTLVRPVYIAPTLVKLGTLAELTQGGDTGPDDGLGGGGDEGSF